MTTYLYRPVADEYSETYDESYGEVIVVEPGDNLGGRASGYLSRSSAVAHGKKSGIAFRIERSHPVAFGERKGTKADDLAHMGQTLAGLVLSGNSDAAKAVAQVIRDS